MTEAENKLEVVKPEEAANYKPMFEPATGDDTPEELKQFNNLSFNRKQRRAMKKAMKKNDASTLRNLFPTSKELLKDPNFRKSLYKDLYEDFIVRKEKYVEAMKNNDSAQEDGTATDGE